MRYHLASNLSSNGEEATFSTSRSVTPATTDALAALAAPEPSEPSESSAPESLASEPPAPDAPAETIPASEAQALFAAIVQDESLGEAVGSEQTLEAQPEELPIAPLADDSAEGDDDGNLIEGGEGNSELLGHGGRDTIDGGLGNDTIDGGRGRDLLHGGEDDDHISGDRGRDQLFGDAGDDSLAGGAGRDTMTGGEGSDTFVLTEDGGNDTITDFNASSIGIALEGAELTHDVLDFSGIAGITSIEDLEIEQDGEDTVIHYGDDTLRLENVESSDLTDIHFQFEAPVEQPEILAG